MNLKYSLGAILSIPLLPILYFQGKKIKATVPRLPEAKGAQGITSVSSETTIRMLTIGESTILQALVFKHTKKVLLEPWLVV